MFSIEATECEVSPQPDCPLPIRLSVCLSVSLSTYIPNHYLLLGWFELRNVLSVWVSVYVSLSICLSSIDSRTILTDHGTNILRHSWTDIQT